MPRAGGMHRAMLTATVLIAVVWSAIAVAAAIPVADLGMLPWSANSVMLLAIWC